MSIEENQKNLNLAFKGLKEMPEKVTKQHGPVVEMLDVSNNKISDFRFLSNFPNLHTLVVDHNGLQSHVKFPTSEGIQTLWANHNKIANLSVFIETITKSFPELRFLSLMNNPAAPSYFNGGTLQQYMDYRYFVISHFPKLEFLDDQPVTKEQREEAIRIYGLHNTGPDKKANKAKRKSSKPKLQEST
ncbi:leucine-rich melanocyte differentiation-associated protein [Lingula anatina]|uniref:Leucine-rich melanocyte differentiation-associated protein n=1 Tax=Lingula anatina TaxID=7574 RepID=A0A1S3J7Q7_LINAN|nr:leucine-rich melanocyte differentiation-associated protein [Lingula anatina]|eukprot:XP_013406266.1 leucine-rich melanocyte differentiation-associated protein [Lingula anatina]